MIKKNCYLIFRLCTKNNEASALIGGISMIKIVAHFFVKCIIGISILFLLLCLIIAVGNIPFNLPEDTSNEAPIAFSNPVERKSSPEYSSLLKKIEGYYIVRNISGFSHLAFIAIEENDLVIYRINIINDQESKEELTRFDINSNALIKDIKLEDDNYIIDYETGINLKNDNYRFYYDSNSDVPLLQIYKKEENNAEKLRFVYDFISNELDEYTLKNTYDNQKQYTSEFD